MSDDRYDLEGVAIIGMAGRFPGARDVDELWRNLKGGVESVTFFTDEELSAAGIPPERLADPCYVKASAVLEDIESFDAAFFDFNPREAEVMDPQHRLFLECSWEALENAGYDPGTYPGAIGVFGGALMNSYLISNLLPSQEAIASVGELQARISNDKDFLTTRVSYKLDLRGPSVAVQTACSSSLVALHLAWQSLLAHQADMALVGGVAVRVPHRSGHLYQEGGIFSPDGHCRAFDARARGTVSGNGVGIVVLKRLEDALIDGDRIHAVIRGSALNNDGNLKAGYTAPSIAAQAEVVATALGVAGIDPATVGLVEAHGTGTQIGDPIEFEALVQAFGPQVRGKGFCAIGSVKSNIGHLDAAAGVASLIKAALAVRDGVLPPTLHFEEPNPECDLARSPFRVQTTLEEWRADLRPRRAGVSSFGVGGTNAHVILEEPPEGEPSGSSRARQPILVSARTAIALEAATDNLARWLRQSPGTPLPDVAFTLAAGRKGFEHRRIVVASGSEEAAAALAERSPGRVFTGRAADHLAMAFLFPGQGAQYPGMGRELYESEPLYAAEIDRCAELLRPYLRLDLRQLLYPRSEDFEAAARRLRTTIYAQPALFVTELALARLWMAWGVEPQAMIGHSLGELVAACLAGILSLEDALETVALRGRLMQGVPPGAMLSVSLSEAELIPRLGSKLALAAVNAPALCTVSGPPSAIEELERELAAGGDVEHRRLHTSHAFHSPLIDPVLEPFAEHLRSKPLRPPEIPVISNRTGAWMTAAEATDPSYWAGQLRGTVRFSAGVETLLEDPARAFLEVGPGRTLATFVREHLREHRRGTVVLGTMRHPEEERSDQEYLLEAAARLWLVGGRVDWERFYGGERRCRVPLPTYPFERRRYWIEPSKGARRGGQRELVDWFHRPLWKQALRPLPPRPEDLGEAASGWLLLADRGAVGEELAARLTDLGRRVVTVPGDLPGEELSRLLRESEGVWSVVHLAELGSAERAATGEPPASALALASALAGRGTDGHLRVLLAASHLDEVTGGEPLQPDRSSLLGIAWSLAGLPGVSCRIVDLEPAAPGALADLLLAEVAAPEAEPVVAYRGGQRWVRGFERVRLGTAGAPGPLREGGTYWIAAGAGEPGPRLAEALAAGGPINLVLSGAGSVPDGFRERIEAAGSRVEIAGAAGEAVRCALDRFGALHGVFSLPAPPGEPGPARLRAEAGELRALAEAVAGRDLDFVLLLGDLAGVVDSDGPSVHAVFGAWADAFVRLRARESSVRWLRAQGDPWWEEPLTVRPVLHRLLSRHAADRLVVSRADLEERARLRPAEAGAETDRAEHDRPELDVPYVAPRDEVEQAIAGVWEELLGVLRVGVHDNFFELGGHSLLATRVLTRIRETLRVDLRLRNLSAAPTVAELAAVVSLQRTEASTAPEAAAGTSLARIVSQPAAWHEPFPLTEVQQAYWLGRTEAFELGSVGTQVYFEIDAAEVDLERYERAWERLIRTHGMLRAILLPDGRQRVLEAVPEHRIEVLDLRGEVPATAEAALTEVRERMSRETLPADRWPLFEVRATLLDGGRTRLHVRIDNLIADAWSFGLIGRELDRLYRHPDETRPAPEISFRDYVLAARALRETDLYRRSRDYWHARLDELPGGPELPLAPRGPERARFHRLGERIAGEAWQRLKTRAARVGVSPAGTLATIFAEVLAAWSRSPRFTLNLTLFNRLPLHPQVEELVGDFTSVTLLEVDHRRPESFDARARRLQQRLWDDLDHRFMSGIEVLRELAHRGRRVLMPVVFTSNLNLDAGGGPADSAWGLPGRVIYQISQTPQVWMVSQAAEHGGALSIEWDVVEDLFPQGMAEAMFAAYARLIRRLADEEEAWLHEVRRLVPEEQVALRERINATAAELPAGLLQDGFLARAWQRPEAPAVVTPGRVLSYGELLERSAALGRRLRELGAVPGRPVAVVMEKGWEQVVGVLGTLLSGAAYLPIDPHLPRERLAYLLDNGGADLVLTQSRFDRGLDWPGRVCRLAVDLEDALGGEPPEPVASPADLAYLIYTSGSTGQPKGVMIDHRAALNTVADINRRFGVGPEDRVLALSALSFDLSVYDLFGLLAAGGALVLPEPSALREPARWAELLENERVTIWNTVPALLSMLVDSLEGQRRRLPISLRLVLLSGDWIPVSLPARLRALASEEIRIVSLGGATEASIWSILYEIGKVDPAWPSVPYGRPLANQSFHVLDEALEPRPDWVAGELWIGGAGLARGYWGDEEKIRERFLEHPRTGERLYRTGDLGRYLPGGDIEFLGRDDFQVKVQGYRIELGEIEAALGQHPAVRSAVVGAPEERRGSRRLVGYVVPRDGERPTAEELRRFLLTKLPEYMVPPAFVLLDALPLSPNGKVDRKALPLPEAVAASGAVEGPRDPIEEKLAAIWCEVLALPRVGIHDNFNQIGGDSLLATQVVTRVREELRVELPLRALYEHPTLARLAEHLRGVQPTEEDSEEARLARILEELGQLMPDQMESLLGGEGPVRES